MVSSGTDPVATASALAPEIRSHLEEIEAVRRLPQRLVESFRDAGIFRLLVPRSVGGLEVDPATLVRTIEALAREDGAAGWCAMIGATSGVVLAYFTEATAREVSCGGRSILGGVFHPRGRAVALEGGYRATGRWPFASGCEHSDWLLGGCMIFAADGLSPRLRSDGTPEARMMLFRRRDVEVHDTWNVAGLRGTGSHDISVREVTVPAERSVWMSTDSVRERGPVYSFPVFGLLALGIAAVALGIARAAIDDLRDLAPQKVATGARRSVAERATAQGEVARAEVLVEASRDHLLARIDAAWRGVLAGRPIDLDERARLRLAATHAARSAKEAVDAMFETAGGTAVYEASPLARRFRDIHVATQHVMVAPPTYEQVGRLLLGLPTDTELL
jgi:alkylation response protein AidB-like acyl-CoA dehydrogenase